MYDVGIVRVEGVPYKLQFASLVKVTAGTEEVSKMVEVGRCRFKWCPMAWRPQKGDRLLRLSHRE